ncbi:MAG: hypothetical protein CUN56_08890 [Phototrophicales bacterium]|nr:MAG: hypothetical protein CUN56_08890 [Phototrophicales bacterium]
MNVVKSNMTKMLRALLVESLFISSCVFTFLFFADNLILIDTANTAPIVQYAAYVFSGVFGLLNADVAARIWLRIALKGCETSMQVIVATIMTLLSLVVAALTTVAALTENFAGVQLSSPAMSATLISTVIAMSVLQIIGGAFLFNLFSADARVAMEFAGAVVEDQTLTIAAVKQQLEAGRQERVRQLTDKLTREGEKKIGDILGKQFDDTGKKTIEMPVSRPAVPAAAPGGSQPTPGLRRPYSARIAEKQARENAGTAGAVRRSYAPLSQSKDKDKIPYEKPAYITLDPAGQPPAPVRAYSANPEREPASDSKNR